MNDRTDRNAPPHGTAQVDWRDNDVPVSARFEDAYYGYADGRKETAHVFIGGNRLPERWRAGENPMIAELGFGTGLNFIETYRQWREIGMASGIGPAPLRYVSFELAPIGGADMARALAVWPDVAEAAAPLMASWPPQPGADIFRCAFAQAELTVLIGDARTRIADWQGEADAWYLDGFSPARNPELWQADLLADVFARTAPGGTFSTYTAAGWVRRNLLAAGFQVRKVQGFAGKRERLEGHKPSTIENA